MTAPLIQMEGVTKSFGPVTALDAVDFGARSGECVAILGENGAGKSSLASTLTSLYQPDRGRLLLRGAEVRLRGPRDALDRGIGIIHQHFSLVDRFSGLENVAVGMARPGRGTALRGRVEALARDQGFEVDLDRPVADMPVGMRQRVEILKALVRDVSLLILDEPTSVLAPGEVAGFLDAVGRLRDGGLSILLITHKMDEIMTAADRVVVMRRGRVVGDVPRAEATPQALSDRMMGLEGAAPRRGTHPEPSDRTIPAPTARVVLRCCGVATPSVAGSRPLRDVSLQVRAGEILGIAGIDGNGQAELCRVAAGLLAPIRGTVELDGASLAGSSAEDRIAAGVGYVPEDRHAEGLALTLSVAENLALRLTGPSALGRTLRLDRSAMRARAVSAVERFDIRPRDVDLPAALLSGGNQQKVVLAREIGIAARLLIVMQPTKGLDLGAAAAVQARLRDAAAAGVAILYVSTELPHLLEVADRAAVMAFGEIVDVLDRADATPERIGRLMTGRVAA